MNREIVVKKEVGISLGTIAFVILFVLKLMGEIEMGWFWVLTSWLWVPVLVLLSALVVVLGFVAIVGIIGAVVSR